MDKDKGENTHLQKCFQEPGLEAGYSNYTRFWVIYILGRRVFLLTYLVALVMIGCFFFFSTFIFRKEKILDNLLVGWW